MVSRQAGSGARAPWCVLGLLALGLSASAAHIRPRGGLLRSHRAGASVRLSAPQPAEGGGISLKAMTMFSNTYAKNTGTFFCSDPAIAAVVIKGLAEHKEQLGAPLCPCRHYDDKAAEAKDGFWNCPCTPMRERHECHCMLFLKGDDEFAGDRQELSLDEVAGLIAAMP